MKNLYFFYNSLPLFKFILVLYLFFIPIISSFSQVTVNFSSDVIVGCSPLPVNFTDTSTPVTGIISRQWLFGNGNMSIGNDTAPEALYPNPGKYDVTLIVSVDGINYDTIVRKEYITVFQHPASNFNTNTARAGCEPLSVGFQDISLSTDAPLTIWKWDYGDGYTDSIPNPVHIYLDRGLYPVSLTVIDTNQCSDTKLMPGYINVFKPRASFTSDVHASCSVPLMVQFTNTSPGSVSLNHYWSFGDGFISTAINPQHTYNNTGVYNVTLRVTDQNNCSDTLIDSGYVKISSVDLSFKPSRDTVCIDEIVAFLNSSAEGESFHWDFGDGDTSNLQSTSHSYKTSGLFIVSLRGVVNGEACSTVFSDTIFVEKVVADFSTFPHFLCKVPDTVAYTNLSSSNVTTWAWNFGDGKVSNFQNPINVFILTDSLQHFSKDYFDNSLTVTTSHGCSASKTVNSNVRIVLPDTGVFRNTLDNCAPHQVDFTDLIIYNTTEDYVTTWNWTFGDGSTSTSPNPTHIFQNVGEYLVKKTITTEAGCQFSHNRTIRTGEGITTDFAIANPVSCASNPVSFFDTSTDSSKVNGWIWVLGSKCWPKWGHDTLGIRNPIHLYCDTGWFDVTLYASHNGCTSFKTEKNAVHISGPIALFTPSFSCNKPMEYNFTGYIVDATSWQWDFGDGQINTTSKNPVHTYITSGDYTVKLSAFNSKTNCSYESDTLIHVRNLKSIFTTDTLIGCSGLQVTFNSGKTVDKELFYYQYFEQDTTIFYLWNFDGQIQRISRDSIIQFTYNNPGVFTPLLTVHDINRCINTTTRTIKILRPLVSFTANPLVHCAPVDIKFADSTQSDTTLSRWVWTLGDGTVSYQQNPMHKYTTDSLYTISLQVFDTLGCNSTLTMPDFLTVSNPLPEFNALPTRACLNDTIVFTNTTKGNVQKFIWNFGDGQTSKEKSPIHVYKNTGNYTISLSTSDSIGCDTTLVFNDFISIQSYPLVGFVADTLNPVCYPITIKFSDSSVYNNGYSWNWNFGDGASATRFMPFDVTHTYALPGKFDVSLKLTTSNGCADSISKIEYIDVKGPYAESRLLANGICLGDTVVMYIDTIKDVFKYKWDYGDGHFGDATGDTSRYVYQNSGSPYSSLIYWDEDSVCVKSYGNYVYIYKVTADFSTLDSVACVSKSFLFIDKTICKPFDYLQSIWDFGDSTNSNDRNPTHVFDTAGLYTVRIIDKINLQCADTISKIIKVINLPTISLADSNVICRGDSVVFNAGTGFFNYLWFNNSSKQTLVIRDSAIVWGMVQNIQGCWSFPDTASVILVPKPIVNIGLDTTICSYDSIVFDATGIVFNTYLWQDSSQKALFTTDTAGKFYVQVKNICGITSDTVLIVEIPLPLVNLGKDTAICFYDSIVLDATGTVFDQYLWQDSSTNAKYISDTTEQMYVQVYNRCGVASDSFSVVMIPFPLVNLGIDTTICTYDSIVLDAKGSLFNQYVWQDSSRNAKFTTDTAGEFYVQMKNRCGESSDTILVVEIPFPFVDLGKDTAICRGDTFSLNVKGGVFDRYLWHNDSTGYTFLVDTAGLIYVNVYNRCAADTDSVSIRFIPIPLVDLGKDTAFCPGDSIGFYANGSEFDLYSWNTGSVDSLIYTNTAGTFILRMYNVCSSDTDSVSVIIIPLPSVNLGEDTLICKGDTITLNVAGSVFDSYLWDNGSIDSICKISKNGEHFVVVYNNCESDYDTVHVSFFPDSLKLGNDTSFCEGGFIVLKQDKLFDTYLWQDQSTEDTLLVNKTGRYILRVANKCITLADSVEVGVRLLPVVELGNDTAISWESILLDAANSGSIYRWSTGETTQTIFVSDGEKYVWVEVNKEECFSIDTIHIKEHPDKSGCLVDLPNIFSPNSDGRNDLLFVRGYCIAEMDWMIFNRWGEMIFHTTNRYAAWDGTYKGKQQETEVYTYVLKGSFTDGTTFFKKGNVTLLN